MQVIDIAPDGKPAPRFPDRLLTLEEAATFLAVPESSAKRLIKTGRLRAYWVSGKYRINPSDLQAFLSTTEISTKGGGSR
ncbi:helix-turn-helix domain-containing protein [Verrucomicrobium sp. 3C]|uniref:helix-turn-helix domain-containing protein n=1 Tax=Verrucomicrobium sp. 3C TaxID=1134055 RepID=UPI0012DBD309|nr:helix-turn-helix domain-containing protein [Verrucomicrobium sp. 3C]